METAQVKRIRDIFAKAKYAVSVYCDNGIVIDEANQFVLWDDANECVYSIRSNLRNGMDMTGAPFQFVCTSYENIQYIQSFTNTAGMYKFGKDLGYDEKQLDNAAASYAPREDSFLNTTPKEVLEVIKQDQKTIQEKYDEQIKIIRETLKTRKTYDA